MNLHQLLERQSSVVQAEAAGERVPLGLVTVARKMEDGYPC